MDEIISYKMCAVKVRNAKLRNYLKFSGRLFQSLIVVTLKVLPPSVSLLYFAFGQMKLTSAYLVFLQCCSRFNFNVSRK
jgi:hypothetical protein